MHGHHALAVIFSFSPQVTITHRHALQLASEDRIHFEVAVALPNFSLQVAVAHRRDPQLPSGDRIRFYETPVR